MAMERVWLDWGRPCLPAAAAWLVEQRLEGDPSIAPGRMCDLSTTACVLPGRRAGRVLLGQLIQHCRERGLQLIPPRMLTPGDLGQLFAPPARAVATPIECVLAWSAALRQLDEHVLQPLLPHQPAHDDEAAWHALAETAQRLHDDLAGHCRGFSEAADQAGRMEMHGEADRWNALSKAHHAYRRVLDRCDLIDPQDAFRDLAMWRCGDGAIGSAAESQSPNRQIARSPNVAQTLAIDSLVLIGVVELNALQRLAISAFGNRAVALIHAPASRSDSFDDFGCVRSETWIDAAIEIDDDRIHIAERPADQAQCVVQSLGDLNGQRSAAEITIGLGDAGLSSAIEHAAEWAGVSVRTAVGDPLSRSDSCRALALIADWIDEPRFATLAALLRHPDVEHWISKRIRSTGGRSGVEGWITLLDEYFAEHLHERLTGAWLGDERQQSRLKAVYEAVQGLTSDLANGRSRKRVIGEWIAPILEVLAALYGGLELDQGEPARRRTVDACVTLRDIGAALAAAPSALQPTVNASDAIRILLRHAASEHLNERLEGDQIEMLGWLELHLDVAPVLIIAGFNDGAIPQSVHADAFLPDSLRERLGLACNASRYARDAYLLQAILHSRADVTLIAGRRGSDGEPLAPSRLLMACDDQTLLRRVERLCDDKITAGSPAALGLPRARHETEFKVPALPAPLQVPTLMRVTDFRRYLTCPYRYALEKLIELKLLDDAAMELDPMRFGSLVHEVLCVFGQDDSINASDDARKIERYLTQALAERAQRAHGSAPSPAVRVQLARLEHRLRGFAAKQAELRAEGWRIRHCEHAFKGEVALDIPGQEPMPLWGTIDRIDQHERDKTWRILDYKTGDSARSPHKTHHGRERLLGLDALEWRDLQLPLYHYLATKSSLGIRGTIQLGYICLPKQNNCVDFHPAEWMNEHLEHAWECARRIVREIRDLAPRGAFVPRGEVDGTDDFARICQTTVFSAADSMETADERG